jgi:hypothetical protein
MARVFPGQRRLVAFDQLKRPLGRRIKTDGRDAMGQLAGPGGRKRARHFAGLGPGCGLGATCAREASRAEPFSVQLGPRCAEIERKKKIFLLISRSNY